MYNTIYLQQRLLKALFLYVITQYMAEKKMIHTRLGCWQEFPAGCDGKQKWKQSIEEDFEP